MNAVQAYVAPRLFGAEGVAAFEALGLKAEIDAPAIGFSRVTRLGQDLLLEGTVD